MTPETLGAARRAEHVWFYPPQWYWYGWGTLLPISRGHDSLARWCLVIGWTVTGRVVIPLWDCGDSSCKEYAYSAKMNS